MFALTYIGNTMEKLVSFGLSILRSFSNYAEQCKKDDEQKKL